MTTWSRLVRFTPVGSSSPLIGEPIDSKVDVGLATFGGTPVKVNVYSGTSILDAGKPTGKQETVGELLSVLAEHEIGGGSIRCIGLNYVKHAAEANLELPPVPILFLKPSTSLTGPFPAKIVVPKFTIPSESADYESELGVIIGKDCKNVTEADAMEYVLGYTATNDVSSRKTQFEQSQWSFSKGFDTACPIGPCVASTNLITDPSKLHMRGLKNGKVMQESGLDDLIFGIPKLVSFLSQGTTLRAGTLILTGTPHGIGIFYKPPEILRDGDDFHVEILPHIGTLVNKVEYEK
ncbi:hypothetical protein P7C70_g711, partial [Phenoliferia sp. Uapishka_3]